LSFARRRDERLETKSPLQCRDKSACYWCRFIKRTRWSEQQLRCGVSVTSHLHPSLLPSDAVLSFTITLEGDHIHHAITAAECHSALLIPVNLNSSRRCSFIGLIVFRSRKKRVKLYIQWWWECWERVKNKCSSLNKIRYIWETGKEYISYCCKIKEM